MTGEPTGTSAEHAQTKLDVLTSDPDWGAKLMSGDAATFAEFNELSAKALGLEMLTVPAIPAGPVSAAAELDALMASSDKDASGRTWAQRVNAGDAAAMKEFNDLTGKLAAATPGDWATSGFVPNNHLDAFSSMPLRDVVNAGNDLMQRHSSAAVKDLFDGVPPTRLQHEAGKYLQQRNFADKDWMARFHAGDPAARAQFASCSWAIGHYNGGP